MEVGVNLQSCHYIVLFLRLNYLVAWLLECERPFISPLRLEVDIAPSMGSCVVRFRKHLPIISSAYLLICWRRFTPWMTHDLWQGWTLLTRLAGMTSLISLFLQCVWLACSVDYAIAVASLLCRRHYNCSFLCLFHSSWIGSGAKCSTLLLNLQVISVSKKCVIATVGNTTHSQKSVSSTCWRKWFQMKEFEAYICIYCSWSYFLGKCSGHAKCSGFKLQTTFWSSPCLPVYCAIAGYTIKSCSCSTAK